MIFISLTLLFFSPVPPEIRHADAKILPIGEIFSAFPPLSSKRLGMKYYCPFLLAVGAALTWGADSSRPSYRIDTVAGSARIGDGEAAIAAQFSNINGIAVDRVG